MTDLLNIGASGLRAYSRALATVGDNIANAQTAGYARRTVQLREAPAAGDIVLSRNSIRPGGVEIAGLSRSVDSWLVDDARTSSGDAAQASARLRWVDAAERVVTDNGDGIGSRLTAIFNAADELASDPGNQTLRQQFLLAVDETAAAFRQTASGLSAQASSLADAANGEATQLNTDLAALERVNAGLRRARAGSSNEATLLDERDRLIDSVSARLPVTASFDDRGAVTLRMAGSGDPLVANGAVASISVSVAADGRISYALAPSGPASFVPASGSLAGLVDGANHIAGLRADIDTLADRVAADLNAAHQSGLDANGNPGAALFLPGSGASALTAATLIAADVAAADAASSNGNMLNFGGLRGPSGIEQAWAGIANSQAQSAAAARAQDAAASSRYDGAAAAREAISEIDLDREAADLLRFQQAYEAAARTIQVARETMQSILNIF
jgi:flagellar hook-associated protein 1 FlgK